MTNIKDIDPVDFAGGVAHVAAAQLFSYLSKTENAEGLRAVNWFGGPSDETEDLQTSLTAFADYCVRANAGGEQLWRWGNIQGHVTDNIPESGDFAEVALPHRFAFDMFAEIARLAYRQLDGQQLEMVRIETEAMVRETVPGLKLEDSIFEPHGSLGEVEPYQAQFLKDQQAADQAALDRQAEEAAEAERQALSVGETETDQDEDKPDAISLGQQQATGDEEEATDQRQEEGDENGPDASAQGDVSDMADDDADGLEEPAGDTSGAAEEVADQVPDADRETPGEVDAAETDGVDDQGEPEKASSGKSAKRN